MKKIALIFAAVVAVSFASCGNKCGKGECADSCQADTTCAAACSDSCACDSAAACDSACAAGACVCAE